MDTSLEIFNEDYIKLEESGEISYHAQMIETAVGDEIASANIIDLDESSTHVSENLINIRRLRQFEKKYTNDLLRIIREQDFEYGFDSMADKFIKRLMDQNKSVTREWLNRVFLSFFRDIKIITGLVQFLSHIEYTEIYPEGPTMAIAALSHENPEVRECGIRAFENWGTLESLHFLEKLHFTETWLQEYLEKVIYDLKEEFSCNVSSR